jgi:hypothetical protein
MPYHRGVSTKCESIPFELDKALPKLKSILSSNRKTFSTCTYQPPRPPTVINLSAIKIQMNSIN